MDENVRIFNDVLRQMKDFTGPAIKMICGGIAVDTGELVGTGTVVELRGRPYLVTAQHVAAEFSHSIRRLVRGSTMRARPLDR